ncbi:hypothetical protein H696_00943 [Fonticula alba]|uniref:Ribosome maturation protein SDO1/SBDS N-terminal domain-containing protein n=1 Tax=Fonticula alba TaxID=691883 RepID=A0A058ZHG8_FONAL|nr:hypothetical protein H696_00943 [Fonticula alba]KCV73406.1 hypothetical protein H696_00943 [Fonticula alba]|eukprot:XP_009493107.1 hypothetical protein H696_00943 [Fonticula alba]
MSSTHTEKVVYNPPHPVTGHPQQNFIVFCNPGYAAKYASQFDPNTPKPASGKREEIHPRQVLQTDDIYYHPSDSRTLQLPSKKELADAFGTEKRDEIIQTILRKGQIQPVESANEARGGNTNFRQPSHH